MSSSNRSATPLVIFILQTLTSNRCNVSVLPLQVNVLIVYFLFEPVFELGEDFIRPFMSTMSFSSFLQNHVCSKTRKPVACAINDFRLIATGIYDLQTGFDGQSSGKTGDSKTVDKESVRTRTRETDSSNRNL